MRTYETGATRNDKGDKLSYEGFLSPRVEARFAAYMRTHQTQDDGSLRAPDNWQKGIAVDDYWDSLVRHVFDAWRLHRERGDTAARDEMLDLLCAVKFNTNGLIFELTRPNAVEPTLPKPSTARVQAGKQGTPSESTVWDIATVCKGCRACQEGDHGAPLANVGESCGCCGATRLA